MTDLLLSHHPQKLLGQHATGERPSLDHVLVASKMSWLAPVSHQKSFNYKNIKHVNTERYMQRMQKHHIDVTRYMSNLSSEHNIALRQQTLNMCDSLRCPCVVSGKVQDHLRVLLLLEAPQPNQINTNAGLRSQQQTNC